MQFNAKYRPLIASAMLMAATQAQATLTSYTAKDGVEVVYSSVSDVTWTKDANLLGSLFATDGFNTVVNNIIAASSGKTYGTTNYTLTANDFFLNGHTSWFGAMAYVNYLNSISYGGSDEWYLPTLANNTYVYNYSGAYNTATNGTTKGEELAELYYQELGTQWVSDGLDLQPIYGIKDPQENFVNEKKYGAYWTDTEYSQFPSYAWTFRADIGYLDWYPKEFQFYAWAVSPGQISVVPESDSVAMLLLGLGLVGGVVRRHRQNSSVSF